MHFDTLFLLQITRHLAVSLSASVVVPSCKSVFMLFCGYFAFSLDAKTVSFAFSSINEGVGGRRERGGRRQGREGGGGGKIRTRRTRTRRKEQEEQEKQKEEQEQKQEQRKKNKKMKRTRTRKRKQQK